MSKKTTKNFMINGEYTYRGGERVQSEFLMIVKNRFIPILLFILPLLIVSFIALIFELFSFVLDENYKFDPLFIIIAIVLGSLLSIKYGKILSSKYRNEAAIQNKKMLDDEYVRGSKLVNVDEFNIEQKETAIDAHIPLLNEHLNFNVIDPIDDTEKTLQLPTGISFQMTGFFGGTGTGKSNAMMQYFRCLGNYKRVVVDVDGSYYKKFYKKGDIVFCPFVEDGVKWNIFSDIKTKFDPANVAKSLIPEDPNAGQNKFFDDGARIIVEAVLTYLSKQKDVTNVNLWEYVTDFEKIKQIKELDLEAKRLLDFFTNEKQKLTADVLSTVISKTAIRSLEHLKIVDEDLNSENSFSFRKWINDETQQNTIYLILDEDISEITLPLYRVVVELLATEILSSKEVKTPIFMFLDEFPAMGKMEKIQSLLVRARKNFGAVIYSAQDYNQMVEIYKEHIAKTMMGNTNTVFVFRHTDGKYFSDRFDKQEIWEYSESTPMRTTDFNEGLTGNKKKREKILILPGEIARLENHEAYIKSIAGNITQLKFVYNIPSDKRKIKFNESIFLR